MTFVIFSILASKLWLGVLYRFLLFILQGGSSYRSSGTRSGGGSSSGNYTNDHHYSSSNKNSESPLASGNEQLSLTNLYIRGLAPNTTDKDLVNMCQQYGKITSTKAILDKNTSLCKGIIINLTLSIQ